MGKVGDRMERGEKGQCRKSSPKMQHICIRLYGLSASCHTFYKALHEQHSGAGTILDRLKVY